MARRPVVVRETVPQPLRRSEIIDNIHVAFDVIGTTDKTRPSTPSKDNRGPIAYEYFCSHELCRRADARKKRAIAQAVKAGVIFDHNKEPMEPGTERPVFLGDQVFIQCKVNSIGTKIDWQEVVKQLVDTGKVDSKTVDELATACTVPTSEKGAHTFSSSLIIP